MRCSCAHCIHSLNSGCLDVRRLLNTGVTKIGLGTGTYYAQILPLDLGSYMYII